MLLPLLLALSCLLLTSHVHGHAILNARSISADSTVFTVVSSTTYLSGTTVQPRDIFRAVLIARTDATCPPYMGSAGLRVYAISGAAIYEPFVMGQPPASGADIITGIVATGTVNNNNNCIYPQQDALSPPGAIFDDSGFAFTVSANNIVVYINANSIIAIPRMKRAPLSQQPLKTNTQTQVISPGTQLIITESSATPADTCANANYKTFTFSSRQIGDGGYNNLNTAATGNIGDGTQTPAEFQPGKLIAQFTITLANAPTADCPTPGGANGYKIVAISGSGISRPTNAAAAISGINLNPPNGFTIDSCFYPLNPVKAAINYNGFAYDISGPTAATMAVFQATDPRHGVSGAFQFYRTDSIERIGDGDFVDISCAVATSSSSSSSSSSTMSSSSSSSSSSSNVMTSSSSSSSSSSNVMTSSSGSSSSSSSTVTSSGSMTTTSGTSSSPTNSISSSTGMSSSGTSMPTRSPSISPSVPFGNSSSTRTSPTTTPGGQTTMSPTGSGTIGPVPGTTTTPPTNTGTVGPSPGTTTTPPTGSGTVGPSPGTSTSPPGNNGNTGVNVGVGVGVNVGVGVGVNVGVNGGKPNAVGEPHAVGGQPEAIPKVIVGSNGGSPAVGSVVTTTNAAGQVVVSTIGGSAQTIAPVVGAGSGTQAGGGSGSGQVAGSGSGNTGAVSAGSSGNAGSPAVAAPAAGAGSVATPVAAAGAASTPVTGAVAATAEALPSIATAPVAGSSGTKLVSNALLVILSFVILIVV